MAFILLFTSFAGGITACSGGAGTVDASVSGPQQGVIYYLDDHLGNTHLITDSQGTVLHEVNRYPYGLEKNSESTDDAVPDLDYVYTGKEYDEETGLIYFGGRYYSPEMGRWITADPLFVEEPGKLVAMPWEYNLYTYANNSPSMYVDPDGRLPQLAAGVLWFAAAQTIAVGAAYGIVKGSVAIYKAYMGVDADPNIDKKVSEGFNAVIAANIGMASLYGAAVTGPGAVVGSTLGGGFSTYSALEREGTFNVNVLKSTSVGMSAALIPAAGSGTLGKIALGGLGAASGNMVNQLWTGTDAYNLNWQSVGVSAGAGFAGAVGKSALSAGFSQYCDSMLFETISSLGVGGVSGMAKIGIENYIQDK